jgi:hypothetical protein
MGTSHRGNANAKARTELHFTPRYPTVRQGFVATLSAGRDC